MKKLILIGLAILPFQSIIAQNESDFRKVLKIIQKTAKENSARKDSVDWKYVLKEMDNRYKTEKGSIGVIEATKFMLKELHDFHGRIWYNDTPHYALIKKFIPSTMVWPKGMWDQYRQNNISVKAACINNNYGYIRIPGITFGKQDAENAKKIRQQIMDTYQNNPDIKGWIVDLRVNGGGTMWPMLAGLSDFYGNNVTVGAFISLDGKEKYPWIIKGGEVFSGENQVTDYGMLDLGTQINALENMPVVVLTSRATSSSGEVTALSFKGRPHTYFIGEGTSGYTTTVNWQELEHKFVLQLTMSYYADRDFNIYAGDPIQPDLEMDGGDALDNLEADEKIMKAIDWLKTKF